MFFSLYLCYYYYRRQLRTATADRQGEIQMTKITKRQYEAQKAALKARMAELDRQEEDLNERVDTAGIVPVPQKFIDEFDGIEEARWDTKEALRDLERVWITRNWTAADWQQWELVAQNID